MIYSKLQEPTFKINMVFPWYNLFYQSENFQFPVL